MKRFLRHLFLPQSSNNHRAKILHHTSLLCLISVLFISNYAFSFLEGRFHEVLGISANISSEELLLYTNSKRQENGLPPLSLNNQLSQAAAGKAQDMMTKNYWAHIAPDGVTPWTFIKGAGYEYVHAGENLARGFTTSSDVIEAWMASPGHRDNMLSSNYTEVGFAILSGALTGEETVLVVEMLGSRSNVARTEGVSSAVAQSTQALPTVTPIPLSPSPVVQQVLATPTPTPGITITPTSVPSPTPSFTSPLEPTVIVAALRNDPTIDRGKLQRNLGLLITALLFSVLLTDMVIIKRKRIRRVLAHHFDQVVFFGVMLAIIIIITRGSIL